MKLDGVVKMLTRGKSGIPVRFPPAITDIAHYCKWSKCEIKNSGIHTPCRLFTQLLGSLCTNGTLRFAAGRKETCRAKNRKDQYKSPCAHRCKGSSKTKQ